MEDVRGGKHVHVQYEYNVFWCMEAVQMVQRDMSFSSCCVMSITCML